MEQGTTRAWGAPSLAFRLFLLLLVPLLALLGSTLAYGHLLSTTDGVHALLNASGRQRMLSEQLHRTALGLSEGREEDRRAFSALVERFEDNLTALEEGGWADDLHLPPAPEAVAPAFARSRHAWEELRPALEALVDAPDDPAATAALTQIALISPEVTAASDAAVAEVQAWAEDRKRRTLHFLAGTLLLNGGFLVLAWLGVRRFVSLPLRRTIATVKRLADGELHARVPPPKEREFGGLAEAFNAMAARLEEAHDRLEGQAQEMRHIFDSVHDGVLLHDAEGRILQVNGAMRRMLANAADEDLVGRPYREVLPLCDGVCAACTRDFHARRSLDWTDPLTGRVFQVDIHPAQAVGGRLLGAVHVHRDITLQREAERRQAQRLRELAVLHEISVATSGTLELHALAQRVLETLPDLGLLTAEPRAGLYLCEPEGPRLIAHLGEDVPAHPEPAEEGCLVISCAAHGREVALLCLQRPTHSTLEEGLTRLLEAVGSQIALAIDNALLYQVARQSGRAEVAVGVLHNVGNALNGVNVATNLVHEGLQRSRVSQVKRTATLLTEDPGDPRVPAFLEALGTHLEEDHEVLTERVVSLQADVDHLRRLVGTYRTFARDIDHTEVLSARSVVEGAIELGQSTSPSGALPILLEGDAPRPLLADRRKLLHVLLHLLQNAQTAVEARGEPGGVIRVTLDQGDDHLTIRVTDTGDGIPEDRLSRIFEQGYTTRTGGSGYGLHTSALAAADLGGTLTAHSEGPGQGATFTLTLPARRR